MASRSGAGLGAAEIAHCHARNATVGGIREPHLFGREDERSLIGAGSTTSVV
jgi:hypothetical protein